MGERYARSVSDPQSATPAPAAVSRWIWARIRLRFEMIRAQTVE
jgi:hypothetical protein